MDDILSQDLDDILACTNGLWNNIRNKQLLITGGTGFFGCWLLKSFCWANQHLQLNAHALVLTRNLARFISREPDIARNRGITLLEGDVRTFRYPAEEFSFIIHAATESSTNLNAENPLEMIDTILSGTRQVLNFASQNPIESMLYVSSGAVYGKQPPELRRIPETYLGGPDVLSRHSAYAEGKRAAELLCAIHSNINIKIARCFAFVGPYLSLDAHFAIGDFIQNGIDGCPITIKGDGTPYRSYLYASDLAAWLWTILFKGKQGEAYNVGSPHDLQIKDVAEVVANHFDPKPEIIVIGKPENSRPCERYVPDVQKSERTLDLKVRVPFDIAVEKTINWNKRKRNIA